MMIDGVQVSADFKADRDELTKYLRLARARAWNLSRVDIKLCDNDNVKITWTAKGVPFERVRRVTGYLTGDLKTWNDAKRAEEKDRIKHN